MAATSQRVSAPRIEGLMVRHDTRGRDESNEIAWAGGSAAVGLHDALTTWFGPPPINIACY